MWPQLHRQRKIEKAVALTEDTRFSETIFVCIYDYARICSFLK